MFLNPSKTNIFCFIGLFLFVTVQLNAQTLTVTNAATGEPLEMVAIWNEANNLYAITNSKGQADVSSFKNINKIEISSLGFKTVNTNYDELQQKNFVLLMNVSNLNLTEVVLSGTRWRQTNRYLPYKIETISKRDVVLQNPQTAADLLEISGKVFIQKSQQGGGSPMIRGFSTNRLLYTVDGVRMNNAIFRSGNLQNVISLDAFATESTEVLFGPSSVIYGSDAIGGVMSFQTLTPQFSLDEKTLVKGNAVYRYASANNESTGHFHANVGWKRWAFLTSVTSQNYDHLRQGRHGPDDYLKPFFVQRINSEDQVVGQDDKLLQKPSAFSQINVMHKVRFQPNEAWDFQYGFHYSETSPYGRYDRHNRQRDGLPQFAQWDYGPQLWMMNHINITHTRKRQFFDDFTIRLAHQHFEESRINRRLNNDIQNNQYEQVNATSVNLDFKKAISAGSTLFYGAEYIFNDVNSTGKELDIITSNATAALSRYPESLWQSAAVYLSNEIKLNPKTTLQGGLRYNYFKLNADFDPQFLNFPFTEANVSNSAVTGSFGAVYRPTKRWIFKANLGTAFRAPNVDDIGKIFDSEPGAVTVPNPDLKPEYAYNFDLGVAVVVGNFIKLDVTGYYTLLNNAMVRRDFLFNGEDTIIFQDEPSRVQAIQNAANAYVYGLQFGAEFKLPEGFTFSTDLNFQKGEEETDGGIKGPSRHAPPFFGFSRLTYQGDKLNLQLYTQFQGEQSFENLAIEERSKDEIYAKDRNGNNFSPAWYTLNIKALYPLTENLTLTTGLENITDQRYRPFSSGISGAGRNFIMALRANF
ncbi:TonB-dependent receptor [Paucihalobacter ruber]|uniref:TonB-dependent receptor n=2 Tax=Paucihalobacter ruber TaxID=2567861 RepID=A0A506PDU6_9FLAO|nr:TonB-dependent receptor [Paucihalobacter ruber]